MGGKRHDRTSGLKRRRFVRLACDYFGAYRKYMRKFDVLVQFCLAHLIRGRMVPMSSPVARATARLSWHGVERVRRAPTLPAGRAPPAEIPSGCKNKASDPDWRALPLLSIHVERLPACPGRG